VSVRNRLQSPVVDKNISMIYDMFENTTQQLYYRVVL